MWEINICQIQWSFLNSLYVTMMFLENKPFQNIWEFCYNQQLINYRKYHSAYDHYRRENTITYNLKHRITVTIYVTFATHISQVSIKEINKFTKLNQNNILIKPTFKTFLLFYTNEMHYYLYVYLFSAIQKFGTSARSTNSDMCFRSDKWKQLLSAIYWKFNFTQCWQF